MPRVVSVELSEQQYQALKKISQAEYRQPADHVRMLIDEHIKDYNGTH